MLGEGLQCCGPAWVTATASQDGLCILWACSRVFQPLGLHLTGLCVSFGLCEPGAGETPSPALLGGLIPPPCCNKNQDNAASPTLPSLTRSQEALGFGGRRKSGS